MELLEGTDIVFHPNDFTRNPLLYNTTQIGHVVCGEKHSVSRNGYSSFGIYSVTEGTVKLTTKNGAFYAEKGDLLFFDQSEKHLVENGGTIPYEADFAYIFGPNVKEFFEIFYEKFGYVAHDFTPPSMKSVWKEIVKACRKKPRRHISYFFSFIRRPYRDIKILRKKRRRYRHLGGNKFRYRKL